MTLWRLGSDFGDAQKLTGTGVLPPATRAGLGVSENAVPAVATGRGGWALVAWLARGPDGCGNVVRAAVRAPAPPVRRGEARVESLRARARAARRADRERLGRRHVASGPAALRGGRQRAPDRRCAPARGRAGRAARPGRARRPRTASSSGWQAAGGRLMTAELRDRRAGAAACALAVGPGVRRPAARRERRRRRRRDLAAQRLERDRPGAVRVQPRDRTGVLGAEVFGWRGVADGRVEGMRLGLDRSGAALATWCGQSLGSRIRSAGGAWVGPRARVRHDGARRRRPVLRRPRRGPPRRRAGHRRGVCSPGPAGRGCSSRAGPGR